MLVVNQCRVGSTFRTEGQLVVIVVGMIVELGKNGRIEAIDQRGYGLTRRTSVDVDVDGGTKGGGVETAGVENNGCCW